MEGILKTAQALGGAAIVVGLISDFFIYDGIILNLFIFNNFICLLLYYS